MYECHVTINKPETAHEHEKMDKMGKDLGWKTSCIERDPLLGRATYFYFTTHHVDYDSIFRKMKSLSEVLGNLVIREKIEHILYDTKRSKLSV